MASLQSRRQPPPAEVRSRRQGELLRRVFWEEVLPEVVRPAEAGRKAIDAAISILERQRVKVWLNHAYEQIDSIGV